MKQKASLQDLKTSFVGSRVSTLNAPKLLGMVKLLRRSYCSGSIEMRIDPILIAVLQQAAFKDKWSNITSELAINISKIKYFGKTSFEAFIVKNHEIFFLNIRCSLSTKILRY